METDETRRKLFTIEEARALLPVLRPDVERMLDTFREIRSAIESAAGQTGLALGSSDLTEHLQAQGIVPRLFERVQQIVGRIHLHGCVVNGPEAGLIDFPCLYKDEIVFLCWKFDEPTVSHWHRIPDGFAGRRPLLDASDEQDAGSSVH